MYCSLPSHLQQLILEKTSAPTFIKMLLSSYFVREYIDAHKKVIKKIPIKARLGVFFLIKNIILSVLPEENGFNGKIEYDIVENNFSEKLKQFIAENEFSLFHFMEIEINVLSAQVEYFTPLAKEFIDICRKERITGREVKTQFPGLLDGVKEAFSPKLLTVDGLIEAKEYSTQEKVELVYVQSDNLPNIFRWLAPVTKSLSMKVRGYLQEWEYRDTQANAERFFRLVKKQAEKTNSSNELFLSFLTWSQPAHPKMTSFLEDVQYVYHQNIDKMGLNIVFIKTKEEKTHFVLIEYYNVQDGYGTIHYSYKMIKNYKVFVEFYLRSFVFHCGDYYAPPFIYNEELLNNEKIQSFKSYFS